MNSKSDAGFLPSPACGIGAGERIVETGEPLVSSENYKQHFAHVSPVSTTLSPTLSRKRERELRATKRTTLICTSNQLKNCPAPAKLNLFLNVIGQRADGYHLLQSGFQLIDRADLLHFSVREDGKIIRTTDLPGVPAETDLVVRAAKLLQMHTGSKLGADIALEKVLPMGGGLGGGSSDAATTLIALNHLWNTRLSRQQLMQLGLQLGADVPFFLFGQNAFAEGVGEQLVRLTTPECWYVVIEPGVSVPTQAIFSSKALTRNSPSITVSDFLSYPNGVWKNDLQDVAVQLFPEILTALRWLSGYGNAKMTGSGSCVFCACPNEDAAVEIINNVPQQYAHQWKVWKAKTLKEHPLSSWLEFGSA